METDETLAGAVLERHDWLARTLATEPRATLRPPLSPPGHTARTAATTTAEGALANLRARESVGGGIELSETLGQGGMGVVRLGTQESIGRKVAVKTSRPDRRSERNTVELLREAWVTGALEHPNVLPIYDLGLDEAGAPVIVMRLVEGTDWSQLIGDAEAVEARFAEHDLLEWNLRVLMQVCQALRLAHSRGILHRDLKPENVMLGRFGEVYLVDWGIAVSLEPDPEGRFPRVDDRRGVVGTPAYLAPEMLLEDNEALSPQTDIYLLGAILHEMLTGAPPHRTQSVERYVDSVLRSEPDFSGHDDAPDELVQLCRKAMAAKPEDRFADVEAFRRAVQDFLRHRASSRLAEEGAERLAELHVELREEPERLAKGEIQSERPTTLFLACRFAYEAALREWPENPSAHYGLREAIVTFAHVELLRGNGRDLRRLLLKLDDPPAELVEGLATLDAEAAAQREHLEELEKLGREHDTSTGQRTRWFILGVLATFWTVLPIPIVLRSTTIPSHWQVALFPALFMFVVAGFFFWGRESLSATAYNRNMAGLVLFTFVAQLILVLGHGFAGGDISLLLPLEYFLWFVMGSVSTIAVERRLWPTALAYLLAFLASSAAVVSFDDPIHVMRFNLALMSPSHFVLLITALIIWKPEQVFQRSKTDQG